jgi:hypothetical protein
MHNRSRSEQKAIFANLSSGLKKANSYNAFSDEVNNDLREKSRHADDDLICLVKSRLKEPIGPTLRRLDDEYKKDMPTVHEFVFTDKFEYVSDGKKKRFSNGDGDRFNDEGELATVLL